MAMAFAPSALDGMVVTTADLGWAGAS